MGAKKYDFKINVIQYSSEEADTPKDLDIREGVRLLIGRYCMLDDNI